MHDSQVDNDKVNIAFLGSKTIGSFCLQKLIEHPRVNVVKVLTNDRTLSSDELTVQQIAEQHRIPAAESPNDIPECDFLISVQYHKILKKHHINRAKKAAVNLHMAPLPEYRGCNQFSFAVYDGAKEFGTTLHLMDPQIDHGDILFEKRFKITDNVWVKELYNLTLDASKELFFESLNSLLKEEYTPKPQKSLIEERGSSIHYRNEIEDLKKIDLNASENEIDRRIRATYFPPFEPPFALIKGKKVHLTPDFGSDREQ